MVLQKPQMYGSLATLLFSRGKGEICAGPLKVITPAEDVPCTASTDYELSPCME